MRTRRLAGPSLGVLAAVALALSGCTTDGTATPASSASATGGTPSAPASSGAADPAAAAALGQAASTLGNTSFKVTMTAGPGLTVTGRVDAPGGKGTAELVATGTSTEITVKTLLVGDNLYVQVPGVTKTGTWTYIDVSRLPEGGNVGLRPGQIDPANTANLLTSTTDVRQVDPRSYAGSLDLTKAVGLTGFDKLTIDGYGPAAQSVPFTAGLDEQGRLSALTIQVPPLNGKQSAPLEVLYTEYGVPVTVEAPTASAVVQAPDDLYTTLGGR